MISHSRLVANRVKRRSLTRSNRRISLSPGKKNSIVVAVRVRPENAREQSSSAPKVLQVVDRNLLLFDPIEEEEDKFFFQGVRQTGRDFLKKPHKNLPFNFDFVFDGNATNEDVFNLTTKSIIEGVMNGINCSVFAYGATGAGKTYTMIGTPDNPGIIFLMVMALFKKIEEMQDKVCDVSISYLEVYNESIKDLLTPSPPLSLREDSRSLVVSGLSHFKPNNAQHLMQLLHFGNKNRTQHPTDANAESSRSHAVFQVYVRQKDKVSGLSTNVRMAKLSLIDLAGSERATVIANREKARLREGASINQSLLALGSCINALADRKTKTQHIPYRNSKLTRILKDSLGGNCFTVMIAAISPAMSAYEDTYNTLKYADRAKGIQLNLKRNVVNVDAHISKYVKIVQSHQNEIIELKAKLEHYETLQRSGTAKTLVEKCSVGTMTVPLIMTTPAAENKAFSLTALGPLHEEQKRLQEKYLDCESALRLLKAKKNWKQEIHRIHNILSGENKAVTTMDTLTKTMDVKEKRLLNEKSELSNSMACSKKNFEQAKRQFDCGASEKLAYQELQLQHSEMVKKYEHFLEVASLKAKYEETSKSVLDSLATIVRRQQYILEGRGFLTPDLVFDLESVISKLHGVKEVNWADQSSPKKKLHSEVSEMYELLLERKETPKLTPKNLDIINRILSSSERRGYPSGGLLNPKFLNFATNSQLDPVRRSLDETFAVTCDTPQQPCSSGSVLNRTFSPVNLQATSSTPECPASKSLNRTFTPVYERVQHADTGKGRTYADILKSPAPVQQDSNPVCRTVPPLSTQPSNDSGMKTSAPETKTQQTSQAFSTEFLKTVSENAVDVPPVRTQPKLSRDVPASQHYPPAAPLRVLQVTSTKNIAEPRTGTNKTPKASFARPFSFKFKAKENRSHGMTKQTSFLPRPGANQNKQKSFALHRTRSTPTLKNYKPDV